MTDFFPTVSTWRIPELAYRLSFEEMAISGQQGTEGIALWLGKIVDNHATITHVVGLRGPGIIRQPLFIQIETFLMNDVADLAIELGACLIGQVHSHPGAWVDLSETDRKYGIASPHYLSVVAPNFARKKDVPLDACGIHVYETKSGYRRLEEMEISKRLELAGNEKTPFLSVGA